MFSTEIQANFHGFCLRPVSVNTPPVTMNLMSAHQPQPVKAYLCECGKKWTLREKPGKPNRSFVCVCGRVIVTRYGMAYSTGKPGDK
jgi:hypothetical protein